MVQILLFLAFSLIETPLLMAETQVGGSIAGNTTWNLAGSPYIVTSDVTVEAGVSLTVDAGVTVKVNNGFFIEVNGTLNASGTQANVITFTSNQPSTVVGDWNGVKFYDGSGGTLQNCVIEHADIGVFIYERTSPQILNCTIRHNNYGIRVKNDYSHVPQPVVNGCSLHDNAELNYHVDQYGGWYTTLDATDNWWGTSDISEIAVTIYDYNNEQNRAIVNYTSFLDAENGTAVDTAPGGETYLIGGTTGNMTLSGNYLVSAIFIVQSGHELTISPGTTVKFETGAYFAVGSGGTLTAGDAAGSPVVFTSAQASPAAGDWNGVKFYDGSGGTLQNCVIEHADIGVFIYERTSPQILNCTIRHNNYGIRVKNDYSHVPQPVVNGCSLHDNAELNYHVDQYGGWYTTLDATDNWWGTSDISEIAVTIYDYNNEQNRAIVNYTSFLDAENGTAVDTAPGGETYLIGGTTGNMTLSGNYLVSAIFIVQSGHELTISPGTTVKFETGAYFAVGSGGTLTAGDAAGSPVVFTSAQASPAAGDWNGVKFYDGSGGTLQNCVIEYADKGIYIYRNTSPQILNCAIRHNNYGIYVKNSWDELPHPVVNECSLHDNQEFNYYVDGYHGNYIHNGNAWYLTALDTKNNWWGTADIQEIEASIYDYSDETERATVDFTSFLDAENGASVDTAPGGETYLIGGTTANMTLNGTYIVPTYFKVNIGHELAIAAGTTIKFMSGAYLIVDNGGTITAGDAAGSPVVFTSALSPQAYGDWNGVKFYDGSGGTLQNCVIEYADKGIYIYRNTSPQILNCAIRHNNYGIYVKNSWDELPHPVVNECSLHDNQEFNYYVDGYHGNYIHNGNAWYLTALDTKNNWWGTADIQEIEASIYDYSDETERATVDFTSFLDAENGASVDTAPGGETYLIGGTTANMTLNGTYIVPTYFKVNIGHELAIAAGTTIKFMSGAYLIVDNGGTITAGDAAGSPVVFTSALSPQAYGDWNGVKFYDGSGGMLQNCVIEYADIGVYIHSTTSPQILNCTIRHNNRGIQVKNYYSDIPHPVVNGCSLHDNTEYNYYVDERGGWNTTTLDATDNWWGTQNPAEIAATIYDYNDNDNRATVDFDPWKHQTGDQAGPDVSNIRYNNINIASGATLNQPGSLILQASDAISGVDRVEFFINDELKHTANGSTGSYRFDWNIVAGGDGIFKLTVKAYDTLDNLTEVQLENLQVALAVPDTPVITSPESGLMTKERTITVSGTAAKYSEVILFNNNAQVASGISVDTEGGFSIPLDLIIGDNNIQAQTSNRGGQSTKTAAVAVNLDPRPDITRPYSGVTLVDATITVRGSTEAGAVVEVFVNGVSQGTTVATSSGYFSLTGVQLSEGNNAITAVSTNSYGVTSPISAAVHVPLNSRPAAPDGLAASPGDTTMVLSWNPSAEPDVAGYHVYRDGQRLTYNFITETGFTDSRLSNGRSYAYAVTAVDDFGSESNLAGSVTAAPVAGAEWIIP